MDEEAIKKMLKEVDMFKMIDSQDAPIRSLINKYAWHLSMFKPLFIAFCKSNIEISLFKKTRNRSIISDNKIAREYNLYLLSTLCLLKIFIPYWNELRKDTKQELSDKALMEIRGIAITCDLFMDKEKFQEIVTEYPEIKKIPPDFYNIINHTVKGSKGDNFKKYTNSIPKKRFSGAIGYLCYRIDKQDLVGHLGSFLSVSIRNFVNNLNDEGILGQMMEGMMVITFNGKSIEAHDSLFDKIYLGSIGQKSYARIWKRFCDKFPELIEDRIIFGKH